MMRSNTFVTKYTAVNISHYIIYKYILHLFFKNRVTCYFDFIRCIAVNIIAVDVNITNTNLLSVGLVS